MRKSILVFLIVLVLSVGAFAGQPTRSMPFISHTPLTEAGLILIEGEGNYEGGKPDRWYIPKGIIEYPGELEIMLFAYDETVDPAFKLFLNESLPFVAEVNRRADNYEYSQAIGVKREHLGYLRTGNSFIQVFSEYNAKYRYYIQCIYRSEAAPICLEKRREPLSDDGILNIENEAGLSQLNISVWLQAATSVTDGECKLGKVYTHDIEIEVRYEGKLRKEAKARGSRYIKFLSVDACKSGVFGIVLKRDGIPLTMPGKRVEEHEGCRSVYFFRENHPRYWMRCAFIPYDKPIESFYISGKFPRIGGPSGSSSTGIFDNRSLLKSDELQKNIHELPVYYDAHVEQAKLVGYIRLKELDNDTVPLIATYRGNTQERTSLGKIAGWLNPFDDDNGQERTARYALKAQPGYSPAEDIWKVEVARTSGFAEEGIYKYRVDLHLQMKQPPFVGNPSGEGKGYEEKALEILTRPIRSTADRVWWSAPKFHTEQRVTVRWRDESSQINMDVYTREGDFLGRASSQSIKAGDWNQKALILSVGEDYYIAVSFSSVRTCDYEIFRQYIVSPSEAEEHGSLSGEGTQRSELGSKPIFVRLYQEAEHPPFRLTIDDGMNVLWEPDNTERIYHHYSIKPNNRLWITWENTSSSGEPVKYWFSYPGPGGGKINNEPNNDCIWGAEQMIGLTENRKCCARGILNVSSGDVSDYWKINVAENLVDDPEDHTVKFGMTNEKVKIVIFPGRKEEPCEFPLARGVYTYYIGVYTDKLTYADRGLEYRLECYIDKETDFEFTSEEMSN